MHALAQDIGSDVWFGTEAGEKGDPSRNRDRREQIKSSKALAMVN